MPRTDHLGLPLHLPGMPPRGRPAKALAAAPPPVVRPAVAGSVGLGIVTEIELRPGERDNSNLAYIEKLAEAWARIQDHDVFRGIQSAAPLAITDDVADSGSQHPFELISYTRALASGSQTYTDGIILFWIDLQWSATPGVPLRVTAINQMARARSMMSTLVWPI